MSDGEEAVLWGGKHDDMSPSLDWIVVVLLSIPNASADHRKSEKEI